MPMLYDVLTAGLCGRSLFMRVHHFHAPGETLRAQSLFSEPGGKGYNQAVAAARLGACTAFIGAAGCDEDGDACVDRLAREGVQALVRRVSGECTAMAVILTDARGENEVTVYPGASERLSAADIRAHADALSCARVVLLSGEMPAEAFSEAAELCARSGARLLINPAPAVPHLLPALRLAECVTPNRTEAGQLLGGVPDPARVRALGLHRVIVTLGGEGALYVDEHTSLLFPAPRVKAADTTGAGDCFSGALAACLSRGEDYAQAVRFAVAAAAHSVQQPHVLDSLPRTENVRA